MCPFCQASMGLSLAGAVSTGGLAALAVKVSRKNNSASEIIPNSNERNSQNANQHDGEPENSVAK
jgi:hypothetical protein